MASTETIRNVPANNVPYFTPAQDPPAGKAYAPQSDGTQPPSLFTPVTIRKTTFHNRLFLAPLCQYSADAQGRMTPWHMAHLGGIVSRGPGVSITEATAVLPEGRITPEDAGLWSDEQIAPMKEVVAFAHSQGQKIGIQLAHAGRKGSTLAPWLLRGATATEAQGGWPDNIYGPSTVPYSPESPLPKTMTHDDIARVVDAFAAAAKRAVEAGFDVVEIHNAHGFLLQSFCSPASNLRADEYGGSFENRTRFTMQVVDAVRAAIPTTMPLFLRISADDWLPADTPSWTVEQSVRLAPLLAQRGVDLIDVTTGGLRQDQKIVAGPAFQAPFAKAIKEALQGTGCLVGTVGSITSARQAQKLLNEGFADVISVGRGFQRNPGLVWAWADELGVEIAAAHQMVWPFGGRAGGGKSEFCDLHSTYK